MLADGSVRACSPTVEPGLFAAARLGLGALGIITEYTLAVVPAFLLRAHERPESLQGLLESLDEQIEGNDHFEFYWFPHIDRTLTKRNNRVPAGAAAAPLPTWRRRLDDDLLSNGLFELTNRLSTRIPWLTGPVNAVAARALTERESCYIAIHRYHRQNRGGYFAAFESIARAHGGRPHWGKLHECDADYLRAAHPCFDDFLAVRERADPDRRFANPYLDRVLGA